MMASVLTAFLLTAAEPAAAEPAAVTAPPAVTADKASKEACDRKSGSVIYLDRAGAEVRKAGSEQPCPAPSEAKMAIDELGMPVDYKDKKKGKGVVTGGQDCDGADATCRAAGCVTAGGCTTPAGMAINEKGTAGTVKKKPAK